MRLLLLLLTSFSLLAAACTKADDDTPTTPLDELPPATQVGANTFGCLINGEPWYNRGGSFNRPDLSAGFYTSNSRNYLSVLGRAITPFLSTRNDRVEILFTDPAEGMTLTNTNWASPIRLTNEDYVFYRIDTSSYVKLSLTYLNLEMQVASGTFEFTAINNDIKDTLVVTDGRFDVEFVR